MLTALQICLGLALVLFVFVDAFMTTIAVSAGVGPMTDRVLAVCWRLLLRLHRRNTRGAFLTAGGTLLLTTTVLVWLLLLWCGWSLVFLGSDAVAYDRSGRPAQAWDVVYFSGMIIFTLGTGDLVATTPVWRNVSALASFSGLFLVTLAITYLVSVVSAVVMRRALAIQVQGLGSTADEVVVRGWDGTGFTSVFEQQLVGITAHVVTAAEQHLAYPVLHYFHASQQSLSAPLAVATLDDAMALLEAAVPEGLRPDHNAVQPLRFAIERYTNAATSIAWVPDAAEPPVPPLEPLRAAGIPVMEEAAVERQFEESSERRTRLHQLVTSDGWDWPSRRDRD